MFNYKIVNKAIRAASRVPIVVERTEDGYWVSNGHFALYHSAATHANAFVATQRLPDLYLETGQVYRFTGNTTHPLVDNYITDIVRKYAEQKTYIPAQRMDILVKLERDDARVKTPHAIVATLREMLVFDEEYLSILGQDATTTHAHWRLYDCPGHNGVTNVHPLFAYSKMRQADQDASTLPNFVVMPTTGARTPRGPVLDALAALEEWRGSPAAQPIT